MKHKTDKFSSLTPKTHITLSTTEQLKQLKPNYIKLYSESLHLTKLVSFSKNAATHLCLLLIFFKTKDIFLSLYK